MNKVAHSGKIDPKINTNPKHNSTYLTYPNHNHTDHTNPTGNA